MKAQIARLKATRGYRAWERYNDARGGLLAGGVAYFAFFSVFPALTLGFAIFGFVLRGESHLFHEVVDNISSSLPGIVKDSGHPDGIIDASKPPTPDALTITGAVSLVILVLSGLGWLSALREGVRAMFGQDTFKANPVMGRLRDLGVLALLGLSVLVSAAASAFSTTATQRVLGWLGLNSDSLAGRIGLPLVAFVVLLVVDFGIVLIILRLLSGIAVQWRDLREGAVFGAVGIGVLKVAVSYGLVGVAKNPLLASFAVIIGLLLVMNLFSRVILLAASWAATGLAEAAAGAALQPVSAAGSGTSAAGTPESSASGSTSAVGVPVAARVVVTRSGTVFPVSPLLEDHPAHSMEPSFGTRSADRTAVAAGAVLGVVGSLAIGAGRRAVHAAVAAVRR